MRATEFPGLERLLSILAEAPLEVEVSNWPSDQAAIFISIVSTLLAIAGALFGAWFGARVSANHTANMLESAEARAIQQRCRDRYFLLANCAIEAMNSIAGTNKYIQDELAEIAMTNLDTGNWEVIRERPWSPEPPSALPPECGTLLIESSEGDALYVFQNLIAGADSLEGNFRKFEQLRNALAEEVDANGLIEASDRENLERTVAFDRMKYPRAARLADMLGSLAISVRTNLPRYMKDVELAQTELAGIAERNWQTWGFNSADEARVQLKIAYPEDACPA